MLQHLIDGKDAQKFLHKITSIDLDLREPNFSCFSVLLNKNSDIIDDKIIIKCENEKYYVVAIAGCRDEYSALIKSELKDLKNLNQKAFKSTLLELQGRRFT